MRFRSRLLALALAGAACVFPGGPAEAGPEAQAPWPDDVIYLVMPDRFANGDRTNDRDVRPGDPHAYHGGDLAGLIGKLDYIKALGATALWLTPFNDNQDGPLDGKYWAYHGYWIQDFNRVDEHMGTEADVKRLVAEAHARGLKVLFDVVANHTGYDAPIAKDPARRDWFHLNPSVTDWDDPYQNENYKVAGLPDLNTENAAVLDHLVDAWAGWAERTGVDGFRLDTVRHAPIPFWNRFHREVRARVGRPLFTVGEVSYHDPALQPPYLAGGGLSAIFDFSMFETLVGVFAEGRPLAELGKRLAEDSRFDDPRRLAPFLDSHDERRFLTAAGGDRRKLHLALAVLMTLRGTPTLYQGTELAMEGDRDPDNRRDMRWDLAVPGNATLAYTKRLIALRRAMPALRGRETAWADLAPQAALMTRRAGKETAWVVLNASASARTLGPVALPGASGARLADRLGGAAARRTPAGWVFTVPAYGAQVFAP